MLNEFESSVLEIKADDIDSCIQISFSVNSDDHWFFFCLKLGIGLLDHAEKDLGVSSFSFANKIISNSIF